MGRISSTIILLLVFSTASVCKADVFILSGGGSVVGELLNRREIPRKQYVIQVTEKGRVTLSASQVDRVLHVRPEEELYEKIRPAYPDTADGQWALAEWCREHNLPAQREVHLQRTIELDPNNVEARHALGYSRIDGKWTTQDEVMIQHGYKRYKGRWMSQQQIDLLEEKSKLQHLQQEWFQKVKLWRGWLGTVRDKQARENFQNIADPGAIKPLIAALHDDPLVVARLLYIEALAKINTLEAAKALAVTSLEDPVMEVRLTCLDYLEKQKRAEITSYYVSKLRAKENVMVNLAGFALGRLKDP
ncbi:MAG: HEAT repeat domain-containing protein, partial [Thermoguttaceae bacterium]